MFLMSMWRDSSVHPWLEDCVVDCDDEAKQKEASKTLFSEKFLESRHLEFFQVSSDSNLTFWHIVLLPQTTMHILIYYSLQIKRQQKKCGIYCLTEKSL